MSITLYSESPAPIGTSIYTFDGVSVPAQYVPRLTVSTKQNASGTNIDYKINIDYPITATVDGVITAPNTFRCTFSFTALRTVLEPTVRQRILDEIRAFLVSEDDNIQTGNARKA